MALLIPTVAWLLAFLPGVVFIWSALGAVHARHAFPREVADYVGLMVFPSILASALVLPVAVKVRRTPTGAWMLALGAVSLLTYGVASFVALAYYSIRIT